MTKIFGAFSLILLLVAPLSARAFVPYEDGDPYTILNGHVQPLGLIYGIFGADLGVRLAHNLEVGGSFSWFEAETSTQLTTVREFGITLTYFFFGRSRSGGWFVRPGFYYIPQTTEDKSGLTGTQTTSFYAGGFLVGKEWMWRNGLNTRVGFGLSYQRQPEAESVELDGTTFHQDVSPAQNGLRPLLEWSVGWAF
jgi:hypothetical protein